MADIQTPDPANKLRRQYKSKTLGGLFLAEEIVPVTIVDDLSGPGIADRGYPRACIGETGTAAVAAQLGEHWWVTSNRVTVSRLDRMIISCNSTRGFALLIAPEVGVGLAGLTDSVLKSFTDLRVADQTPNDFIQARTVAAGGEQGNVVGFFDSLANVPLVLDIGAIGSFGGGFGVSCDTVNIAFQTNWFWTEFLVVED